MHPLIHTTRPPADERFILLINATAAQMEPTSAWSAVPLCARIVRAKTCQAADWKWGAEIVASSIIWHVTSTTSDDAPWCWCYATDIPALITGTPTTAPALSDHSAELASARARIDVLTQAIHAAETALSASNDLQPQTAQPQKP